MRTPAQIMADMEAITSAGAADGLDDAQVSAYEALEAELRGANRSAEVFSRHEAYKTPIVGFPAVIKPAPRGDAALDHAFNAYLRTGQPNADIAGLRFAQTEGTPSAGGYAVPDGFRAKLTERRLAFGGLLNAAEQLTTATGSAIEWPTVDSTSDSAADVVAEGASSAAGADFTFGTVTLNAYRYASTGTGNVPVKVSYELLQDASFDVGAYIARALGDRIRRKQAKDVLQASGSSEPTGLMYGTAGTLEADVLSGTNAQNLAALNDLVHALDSEYRERASWIFNDTTAAGMEAMLDAAGRPLLINSGQGIEGRISRPTLLGYPVIIDPAALDVDTNDQIGIAFGVWDEAYIVRHVRDVQVLVNPYTYPGYVAYDAWARMDGQIQNTWAYVTGEGV